MLMSFWNRLFFYDLLAMHTYHRGYTTKHAYHLSDLSREIARQRVESDTSRRARRGSATTQFQPAFSQTAVSLTACSFWRVSAHVSSWPLLTNSRLCGCLIAPSTPAFTPPTSE